MGNELHIGRRKALALLAYLAVERGAHSRESLAAFLWPEYDHPHALANLRRVLSALKAALGEGWLQIDRATVELTAVPGGDLYLDVDSFQQRLARCGSHAHAPSDVCAECVPLLTEAVELNEDGFLQGLDVPDSAVFEEWQLFQTEALHQQLLGALERLVRWHKQQRNYEEALGHARSWLSLDPLDEVAHSLLMELYAGAGQTSAALRQYQLCERVLAQQAGRKPSELTRQLYESLRSGGGPPESVARGEAAPPQQAYPLTAPPTKIAGLPTPLTSFVGREDDVTCVTGLLERSDVRLITLTGPGGTGKTRLAIRVARSVSARFGCGIAFVSLASVRVPNHVLDAMATALGVVPGGDDGPGRVADGLVASSSLLGAVQDRLRNQEILLLLDNFEHVSEAAPLLTKLLQVSPKLKILVTSRALLGIYGEHSYEVRPLAVPDPSAAGSPEHLGQVEAVQLFVERARAARSDFALTVDNASTVADMCGKLDGLPLAIELAAAHVRLLPLQAISERLFGDPQLLGHGPKDLPTRQLTLKATLDWSYSLLGEAEQQHFRRLGAFVGGFGLEAAQAVAAWDDGADLLGSIARLVDSSLVQSQPGTSDARFSMLETVRAYALTQLAACAEKHETEARHATFFLGLAQEASHSLYRYDAQQVDWLDRLTQERDNLRAALAWATEHDVKIAVSLVVALGRYWELRGAHEEGVNWLTAAARVAEDETQALKGLRAEALYWAGRLMWEVDLSQVAPLLEQSLSLWRSMADAAGMGRCLAQLGYLAWHNRDLTEARALLRRALGHLRRSGDDRGLAQALCHVARVEYDEGNYEAVQAVTQESVELGTLIGSRWYVVEANRIRALAASIKGDRESAECYLSQNLEMAQEAGDILWAAIHMVELGWVAVSQGDTARAKELYERCAALRERLGERPVIGWANLLGGRIAHEAGNDRQALVLMEDALGIGRQRGEEDLIGWALHGLGILALSSGDKAQAKDRFAACLPIGASRSDRALTSVSLVRLAQIALSDGEVSRGARLIGYAQACAEPIMGKTLFLPPRKVVYQVKGALEDSSVAAAYAEGQAMSLEEIIAFVGAGRS
jgi:predicted ATPase